MPELQILFRDDVSQVVFLDLFGDHAEKFEQEQYQRPWVKVREDKAKVALWWLNRKQIAVQHIAVDFGDMESTEGNGQMWVLSMTTWDRNAAYLGCSESCSEPIGVFSSAEQSVRAAELLSKFYRNDERATY